MTVHIGLDLGTNCGFAVLSDDGGRLDGGTWDLRVRSDESAGMRLVRFRVKLNALLNAWDGGVVSYEIVRRHEGTKAAHVYGALRDRMLEIIDAHPQYEARDVSVADIKRLATGKGNAGKGAMIAAALKQWNPPDGLDDNQADALWLAEHGRLWLRGEL